MSIGWLGSHLIMDTDSTGKICSAATGNLIKLNNGSVETASLAKLCRRWSSAKFGRHYTSPPPHTNLHAVMSIKSGLVGCNQ